jgi:uncharacterized membrane protein
VTTARLGTAVALLALPLAACEPSGAGDTSATAQGAAIASAAPTPARSTATLSVVSQGLVGADETLHFTGTEPFWGGEATGTSLTYSTPENQQGVAIEVARSIAPGTLSFSGTLDGKPFALAVTNGRCSDGMSDRSYPYTAALRIGEDERRGCAWGDKHRFDDLGKP